MNLTLDHVQIKIIYIGADEAAEYGGVGWFYDDSRSLAVGPFKSPAEAVRAVADRMDANGFRA